MYRHDGEERKTYLSFSPHVQCTHTYIFIILSSNARPMHQFLLTLGVNNISKNKTLSSHIYIYTYIIGTYKYTRAYITHHICMHYTRGCTFLFRRVYAIYIYIYTYIILHRAVSPLPSSSYMDRIHAR